MNIQHHWINKGRATAILAVMALALSLGNAMAYHRVFSLTLVNNTANPVTFTIVPGSCYQGTGVGDFGAGSPTGLVHGPVARNSSTYITIARDQEDCDGDNGYFDIIPSGYAGERQKFGLSNDGGLWEISPLPNRFSGKLTSENDGTYIFYTWTLQKTEARLSAPLDERLTMPRNQIARNAGVWDGGSEDGGNIVRQRLEFRRNGFRGMTYSECWFAAFFHAQHIVRMRNKNGKAYFMVSNSNAYLPSNPFFEGYPDGHLSVYRSDAVNPATDLVVNQAGTDGEIVWEHVFNSDSPVGAWNHPCKMELIGDLLLVCMLDWNGSACRDGYGRAVGSGQALLFYDVRDPENPKFWGRMTNTELGIGDVEDASMVHIGDKWLLYAGSRWWHTKKVSPNLGDWTFGGTSTGISGNLQGQYFNSYELYDRPGEVMPPGTLSPGSERVMWGNGEGWDNAEGNHVSGDEHFTFAQLDFSNSFFPTPTATNWQHRNQVYRAAPNLWSFVPELGKLHSKDYDAACVTVCKGMPVFYSPLIWYRDGALGLGEIGDTTADKIWQLHNPANTALVTPHPDQVVTTDKDSGPGSLRRAIGYGGRITFDPLLNGKAITLVNGPLCVYPYDVNVDASALPLGISILSQDLEYQRPAIQVAQSNTLTMSNFRTGDGLTFGLYESAYSPLPFATGGNALWSLQYVVTRNPDYGAAQSGAIKHSQSSYVQSAVTGPGTLSFWWKVSSQASFDFLRFEMDGVQKPEATQISGNVDWQQKTIPIPAGTHSLRWTYAKDGSTSAGTDAAWLDSMQFIPGPPVIAPQTASGTQGLGFNGGFTATGQPTSYGATGLPAGLFLNQTTGAITGSPSVSGTFVVNVSAANAGGSGTGTWTITIAPTAITVANGLDIPDQHIAIFSTFFGQASNTHDGVDAVQSAATSHSGFSYLDTNVYGPGTLTFWWKVSSQAGNDFLTFTLDDLQLPSVPKISGETNWQQVTVAIPAGQHGIIWFYEKDAAGSAGLDAGFIDQVTFVPTLAVALDTPPVTWTTSGNVPWFGQTGTTHDVPGNSTGAARQRDAAQSGDIIDSQSSVLGTTVTGPATLTFWWKVSSESTWDFLRFRLDGAEVPAAPGISGEVDWQQMTVSILAGSHSLQWTYSKDGSQSNGADAGWVDQVVLTPGNPITSSLAVGGTQGTPFSYQIAAANGASNFFTGELPPGLTRPTISQFGVFWDGLISGTPTSTGTYNISLGAGGYNFEWGTNDATLVVTIGPSVMPNGTAVDATNLTWSTGGNGNWYGESGTTHDSVDAARGSTIGDSHETHLETTVTGPGALSFWWKVSSEVDHDFLRFEIDGGQVPGAPAISGEVDWQQKTLVIPPGVHTLDWRYLKDESNSVGQDAGWVDQVVLTSSLVTNANNNGAGSLRQVLADVPTGGFIGFAPGLTGPITLASELVVNKEVTIDAGSLAGGLTISGSGSARLFYVAAGGSLTLRRLTLTGGNGVGAANNNEGGAIYNLGTTMLERCTLAGNNALSGSGGVVRNEGTGTLTLTLCTLYNNHCLGYGGAIYTNSSNPLTLTHCTISGNSSTGFYGGGILTDGPATLINCIVSGNTAPLGGPDILRNAGAITPVGVNFIGNTADSSLTAGATILTGNAMLAPLGNHGGPTQTMPPQAGSPAIDGVPVGSIVDGLTTDQRGFPRVAEGTSLGIALPDIGAVETSRPGLVFTLPANPALNASATLKGSLIPDGIVTSAWFEWGTMANHYTQQTPLVSAESGTVEVPASSDLTGLTPGLNYHTRVVAANVGAVVRGADVMFGSPAVALTGPGAQTIALNSVYADPGASASHAPLAIAAAQHHTLALRADGTVVGWGDNASGQNTAPPAATNVLAIATGGTHSLALRGDGTVVGWGSNSQGQTTIPASATSCVAVAAGYVHSLALLSDTSVVGWGGNTYGETSGDPSFPSGVIVSADQPLTHVVAIAAGAYHSLALRADGSVVGWGWDVNGQITIPANATNVVAIAAGEAHSLALRADGTVVGWGDTFAGKITIPAAATNVVAIAAGGNHSLALRADGTVIGWGYNNSDQTTIPAAATNVVAIAAGGDHSLALRADGTMIGWGRNTSGQITIPAGLSALAAPVVSGNLNSGVPGTYPLTYTSTNVLGGVGTATRTVVVATALESWRQTHFGSIANSGNGANHLDIDLDGLFNLIEFAFGLNPLRASSRTSLPPMQIIGTNAVITFTQPNGVSGITYRAEWSSTLQANDWHAIPDTGTGAQHTFSVPVGSAKKFFMRLNVTEP